MPPIPSKYYYLTLFLLGSARSSDSTSPIASSADVAESGPTTEKDIVNPLAKAYASGLMDEAEYLRIQASMRKLKEGPAAPAVKKPRPKLVEATPTPIEEDTTEAEEETTGEA